MSRVYLLDLPHDFGLKGLANEGKVLKFKFNGDCVGQYPIDFSSTSTMQEVDIVSVLVFGTNVELAFSINGVFLIKAYNLGLSNIVRTLNSLNGLIFVGKREGSDSGVTYVQYIYSFLKGAVSSLPNHF